MPENLKETPISGINLQNKLESDEILIKTAKTCETATTMAAAEETKVAPKKYDINDFQLIRILNNNSVRKSIALLGTFPHVSKTDEAIILFEKKAFQESDVRTPVATTDMTTSQLNTAVDQETDEDTKPTFFDKQLKVQTEFINNIYGSFECVPSMQLSSIKVTVVYPATEKHIEKYSISQKYLINETPKHYKEITLPYIESSQFSLDWVYNILEHKQESERIVFEDNDSEIGFILLPDLKWDGRNLDTLYLLVIPHKHDIKSLRDLDATHLPLLRNMRQRTADAIEQRYGLCSTQLRMYFHYQPSFYHLHVHVNPVRNDAPGIWCEKSHMLDTVINNLELMSDYYKRATLPFVLYEGNKLLDLYENEMEVRKKDRSNTDNGIVKENATESECDGVAAKKIKIG